MTLETKSRSSIHNQMEEDLYKRLDDLREAVQEVTTKCQQQIYGLETSLPVEVKTRESQNEKLKKRLENVIKSLSQAIQTTRDELGTPQTQFFSQEETIKQLVERMTSLELAQSTIVGQVDERQEIVKGTINEFIKDSDAMIAKLAGYIEKEREERY